MAVVYPYPHVLTWYEVAVAVMAVLAPVLAVDPYSLAHGDLPGHFHVTVAPFGIGRECLPRFMEQDLNPLPGDIFCCWVAGSFLHCLTHRLPVVLYYQRPG